MSVKKERIVLAKLGLDSHDNGLRIVAKWLKDAGYEIIYLGLYNSCEGVVKASLEENAQLIGISFLGGGHLFYAERLMDLLRRQGLPHIKVFFGGVIAPDDIRRLKDLGISAVFTPGTPRVKIIDAIQSVTTERGPIR